MPRLQEQVQQAIDDRVAGLTVRYGKRGIPLEIRIDPVALEVDQEHGFGVLGFWRGTRGGGGPSTPSGGGWE